MLPRACVTFLGEDIVWAGDTETDTSYLPTQRCVCCNVLFVLSLDRPHRCVGSTAGLVVVNCHALNPCDGSQAELETLMVEQWLSQESVDMPPYLRYFTL